jgi:hypothetical protein
MIAREAEQMVIEGLTSNAPGPAGRWLKGAIRALDAPLRLVHGVFEFTPSEECLLRIGIERADADIPYPDGVTLRRGERVIVLHFWNEHLPPMPGEGPTFAWANRFRRQLNHSLRELAVRVQRDPRLRDIKGVRALLASASPGHRDTVRRFGSHFGLEKLEDAAPRAPGPADRLWAWLMLWTFNPPALRGRDIAKPREVIGMSTQALISRFGAAGRPAVEPRPLRVFRPAPRGAGEPRPIPVFAQAPTPGDRSMAV